MLLAKVRVMLDSTAAVGCGELPRKSLPNDAPTSPRRYGGPYPTVRLWNTLDTLMSRLLFSSLFVLLTLTACNGGVEDTRPGQPVKHRQDAFKAMLRVFEPMGVMLREKRYDADQFAPLAAELVARRDAPWAYFTANTDYPPTRAKAEVWSRADAFEAERQLFFSATDALLTVAGTGELAQIRAAYDKVYDSCKSCHRDFKVK